MPMQMDPQYQPGRQPQPELDQVRKAAIAKLEEAVALIDLYKKVQARQPIRFEIGPPHQDDIDEFIERHLFPLYVGPPGEVCDSCGGSGRKNR